MTVAELGIKIDTSSAAKAAADLDRFAASAKGADSATSKFASNVVPFRRAVDAVGASSRNTAMMMRNLSFQVNDIATGLASGQSPFQILAQQGGQVYQALQMGPGGVGGSLQAIRTQLVSLITPARLAAVGIVAVGVAAAAAYQSWKSFTLGIDDAARASGIAQQEFSKLQTAASFKGISAEDFQSGLKAFGQRLDEARNGAGELFKLFDANKVAISDNATAFSQLANLIKGAETDTKALYYIQSAGLPATMEWVRLLRGGADSLEMAKKEASVFAANKEMIAKAREFDEAWNMAWTNFKADALSAIQSSIEGISKLGELSRGALVSVFGESDVGKEMLKRGQGTPLGGSDLEAYNRMRQDGINQPSPLKITVDPRSIKDTKDSVDSLAESMRRLNEQRQTALDKAQRETSELLSFAGASSSAALAQAELAKYRERNISITPQLKSEISAWADQLARVRELNNAIREIKSSAVEFATGFASELRHGATAMEALTSATNRLADRLIDMALNKAISSLIGGLGGSLIGGGSGALSGLFHSGGIVGVDRGSSRYVHPAYFDNAPRFHSGGIAGNEVPVIARQGEGIFTPAQMKAMGGGGAKVVVNVTNNAGADVSVGQSRKSEDGTISMEVVINRAVKNAMMADMANYGPISQGMARRFGSDPTRGIG